MLRGCDHARPGDSRRREQHCGASRTPVSLVSDEDPKLLEVAGLPVAEVNFLDCHSCGNTPTKLSLVREPNMDIENAFLKFVFNGVHDFPAQTAILPAGN
jgi:hypothetical protein